MISRGSWVMTMTCWLISCTIVCCAAWSAAAPEVTCVCHMGLWIRVSYGDVPCQWFAFGPREKRCLVGFVSEEKVDMFDFDL